MASNKMRIIGENSLYVADDTPHENKDGWQVKLKAGYSMPDGTHYVTGKNYTELMSGIRNIRYCDCPLCHDTQSGLKTILASSGMTVRELAEEISLDDGYSSYTADEIREIEPEQFKPVDEIANDINRWSENPQTLTRVPFGTVRLLATYLNVKLDQMYDDSYHLPPIYVPWDEDSIINGYVNVDRHGDEWEVTVPEFQYLCDDTYWNARHEMEEQGVPVSVETYRTEAWSSDHRKPMPLPKRYRNQRYQLSDIHSTLAKLNELAANGVPVDEKVTVALTLEEESPLRLAPLSEMD